MVRVKNNHRFPPTERTEPVVYSDEDNVAIEQIRRPVKIRVAVTAAQNEAAAVNPYHNGLRPAFRNGLAKH